MQSSASSIEDGGKGNANCRLNNCRANYPIRPVCPHLWSNLPLARDLCRHQKGKASFTARHMGSRMGMETLEERSD